MVITGRKTEQKALKRFIDSDKAEFVAVFGRRRVGKTFLIREFFNSKFAFYHTGLANTGMKTQLHSFNTSLNHYGKVRYPDAKTWLDSFEQLKHLLSGNRKR